MISFSFQHFSIVGFGHLVLCGNGLEFVRFSLQWHSHYLLKRMLALRLLRLFTFPFDIFLQIIAPLFMPLQIFCSYFMQMNRLG